MLSMRKSGPEYEGGVNDAEAGEHQEEEVMPQLMRKISAQSVSGMSTVTVQPPEKYKKPPKPVSPIKVHRKPKTTTQEALKAIPPLLTLVLWYLISSNCCSFVDSITCINIRHCPLNIWTRGCIQKYSY